MVIWAGSSVTRGRGSRNLNSGDGLSHLKNQTGRDHVSDGDLDGPFDLFEAGGGRRYHVAARFEKRKPEFTRAVGCRGLNGTVIQIGQCDGCVGDDGAGGIRDVAGYTAGS